jgi:hypothetical protein
MARLNQQVAGERCWSRSPDGRSPGLQASGQLPLGALIQKDPNRLRASRRLSEGWHIEVHLSAKACIHNAVRIARAAGVDPDQITVEFAP